jgi:5-(carboxyamino)imidazole ribonucleotide synthase
MVNLLGEEGFQGEAVYEGLEEVLQKEGVHPHLYGKRLTKPFRKMGHVTIVNESAEDLKALAYWVKDKLKIKA